MPPRSESWSSVVPDEPGFVHPKDGTAPLATAVAHNSHHVVATNAKVATPRQPPGHTRAARKHRGALRFGTHGWSGVASTTLTLAAAFAARHYSESAVSSTLSLSAIVAASISASSGVPLIGQAPVRTVISKNVIPPHREAFRRTASSVYYLSGRIAWNHMRRYFGNLGSSNDGNASLAILDWTCGCFAVLYAAKYFLPRIHETEWRNGNTYVFVVPMASGIIADAIFQTPLLQCNKSSCWNEDIVTEVDLLWILLSALVVAFVFTLAFRGMLGVRKCYWGSACIVHGICLYLVVKALPFILA